MALDIHITNEVVGETPLYEYRNQNGEKLDVPAYRMIVRSDTGYQKEFAVTRDTYEGIQRGVDELYTKHDECPPNVDTEPYDGYILEHEPHGFQIGVSQSATRTAYGGHTLQGIGPEVRSNIRIHKGPGTSEGCFLLSDEDGQYENFMHSVRRLLAQSREQTIRVHVTDRYLDSS
jgi:hypothetical protein